MKFNIGDIVVLNSGGPSMTILNIFEGEKGGTFVSVAYTNASDPNTVVRDTFNVRTVRLVRTAPVR